VHALGLANWHARHGFCNVCGSPTEILSGGHVRQCPTCASQHFPRYDPAVIMLVVDDDDRALFGHNPAWPPGRFSTLAGFVEPGESLEAAVIREVFEEVGVVVDDVIYEGSQPWPFPSSLMLGYTARVKGDQTISLNDGELADAQWVSKDQIRRGEVVALPPPVSIAYRIITDWLGS
jgi:NAD+ diphosphatase